MPNNRSVTVDGLSSVMSGLTTKADARFAQNAFANVTVGNTTIGADSKSDTLTLVAGNNVTITPDAQNDSITIAATGGGGGGGDLGLSVVNGKLCVTYETQSS